MANCNRYESLFDKIVAEEAYWSIDVDIVFTMVSPSFKSVTKGLFELEKLLTTRQRKLFWLNFSKQLKLCSKEAFWLELILELCKVKVNSNSISDLEGSVKFQLQISATSMLKFEIVGGRALMLDG